MILLITPGFAADESDESCIPPLQLLVKGLLEKGVGVKIIALEYPFHADPYQWHGAAVFPCNGQNRRWLRGRTFWRATRRCNQCIGSGQIKNIHSFWLGQAWLIGRALSWRNKLPHTTTLMGQDVLRAVNKPYLWFLNDKTAANTIALSPFHANQLEKETGFLPGAIIPWGVLNSELDNKPKEMRAIDLLGTGSLLPVKNWDLWVQVVARVARIQPTIRAVLIGDGPEKKRLTALVEQLGLSGQIQFVGQLPRSEVLSYMRNSKVLLHTSIFESFGFVLAEAAAAGCDVVGTPVGIARETGTIGNTVEELAHLVLEALKQKNAGSRPLFLLENTVSEYIKYWQNRASGSIRIE